MTDDHNAKRRMVLEAAIRTISTACRHLYEDDIEAAKASSDILGVVRLKAQLKKDWETWSAPLVAAMEALDKPPLVVMPIPADEADGRMIGAPSPVVVLSAEELEERWPRED
jgi:hypothetical protein